MVHYCNIKYAQGQVWMLAGRLLPKVNTRHDMSSWHAQSIRPDRRIHACHAPVEWKRLQVFDANAGNKLNTRPPARCTSNATAQVLCHLKWKDPAIAVKIVTDLWVWCVLQKIKPPLADGVVGIIFISGERVLIPHTAFTSTCMKCTRMYFRFRPSDVHSKCPRMLRKRLYCACTHLA